MCVLQARLGALGLVMKQGDTILHVLSAMRFWSAGGNAAVPTTLYTALVGNMRHAPCQEQR